MTTTDEPSPRPSIGVHPLRRSVDRRSVFLSLLLLFAAWGSVTTKNHLRASREGSVQSDSAPPLYLPAAEYVRLVTLGFDSLAGKVLWFYTINYFGREFHNHGEMEWFGEMCELVTTLDPRAEHVYEFCGTLLSWVGHDPQTSEVIFSRAVAQWPESWRFLYLRAFNRWYFLKERTTAAADLTEAAKLPGAPPQVASLAARLLNAESEPETAVRFLAELLSRTPEGPAREALSDRLKRAKLTRDLAELQRARTVFEARLLRPLSAIEELTSSGVLLSLPTEPFGGRYVFNPATQTFLSTIGEKGLEYREHTAETGLYKKLTPLPPQRTGGEAPTQNNNDPK